MPKGSETNSKYEKLLDFLEGTGLSSEEVISRIQLPDINPAVSFYRTVVAASQEVQEKIVDKSLDISDKYQASILRILEVGDKIAKTVSAARMEAYPTVEIKEDDTTSLGDRKRA